MSYEPSDICTKCKEHAYDCRCEQPGIPGAASPVQGAASASGEAKGAAVKPWQERARERWPDFPAEQLGQWAATECKDAEIADWRALAERAQAAQPSGAVAELSDDEVCALDYAVRSLRAIAERRELLGDMIEPLNDIRAASSRAKHALARLEPVARRLCSATPAPEQEAAFKNDLGWGKCQVLKSEAAQVAPPGAQEVQDIMFEVFEYAKLSEGIDKAEGEARAYQRDAMLQQDRKIRNMISALTAPVPATTPAEQPQGDVMRGKSGASSTAFDDQYAEDPTGAENTDKGGE